MTKYLLLAFLAFNCTSFAQTLSGEDLLNKAITYHDPNNVWSTSDMSLVLEQARPSGEKSQVYIELKNSSSTFLQKNTIKEKSVERHIKADTCSFLVDGSDDISEDLVKEFRLNCDRTKMMRNYYSYLYGLPMKLKDPGTIVDPVTEKVDFQGKAYLRLKVTYQEEVGKDTWYFYFDPTTYAMEVYQFYHDESINDGEYILLKDETELLGMRLPKYRAWYINKDDKFLGSDDLLTAEPIR